MLTHWTDEYLLGKPVHFLYQLHADMVANVTQPAKATEQPARGKYSRDWEDVQWQGNKRTTKKFIHFNTIMDNPDVLRSELRKAGASG